MMSGFAASAGGALSALGQQSPQSGVQLGGISFSYFEVPEKMPFGGEQNIAAHKLPGGVKIVQAMGFFETDKSWIGAFWGPGAVAKALSVATMHAAGAVVSLVWAEFSFAVVIKSFICDYQMVGAWLPYRITCEVVPPAPPAPTPTAVQAANSDLSTAAAVQSKTDPTGSSAIQTKATTQVKNFQANLPAADTGAVVSGQGLTQATSAGTVSLGNLDGLTTEADNGVSSVNLNAGQPAPALVTAVNQTVQSTSDVAATQAMSANAASAQQNLELQQGYNSF